MEVDHFGPNLDRENIFSPTNIIINNIYIFYFFALQTQGVILVIYLLLHL